MDWAEKKAVIQADVDMMPDDPEKLKRALFDSWCNRDHYATENGELRIIAKEAGQRADDAEAALRAVLHLIKDKL